MNMSTYKLSTKAGNFHVWTKDNNWVAEFGTQEAAERFIDRKNKYTALIAYHTDLLSQAQSDEARGYQRGMIAAYRLELGAS